MIYWILFCYSAISLCRLTGDDTFTIQHEDTGKCFLAQTGSLTLGDCSSVMAQSWKWGSGHRLFHTGLSACLGLDILSKTLSLTSCSDDAILQWHCYEGFVITTFQMRLSAMANGTVTARRNMSDSWRRGGTTESICEQSYQSKKRQRIHNHNYRHPSWKWAQIIIWKEIYNPMMFWAQSHKSIVSYYSCGSFFCKALFPKLLAFIQLMFFGTCPWENNSMDFLVVMYNKGGDPCTGTLFYSSMPNV